MNVNDPRYSGAASRVASAMKTSTGRGRALLATARPVNRQLTKQEAEADANAEDSQTGSTATSGMQSKMAIGSGRGTKSTAVSSGRARGGRAVFTTDTDDAQSMEASGNTADSKGQTGGKRGPQPHRAFSTSKPNPRTMPDNPQQSEADDIQEDSKGEPGRGAGRFPVRVKKTPAVGNSMTNAPGHKTKGTNYKPKTSAKAEAKTWPDGRRPGNPIRSGDDSYE